MEARNERRVAEVEEMNRKAADVFKALAAAAAQNYKVPLDGFDDSGDVTEVWMRTIAVRALLNRIASKLAGWDFELDDAIARFKAGTPVQTISVKIEKL